ncbi:MAG: DNA polymerase III subunit alpha [Bacteroidia bacterium]|nr:DNA polymerase III subunit alpha [Bacteroidia bacterium]
MFLVFDTETTGLPLRKDAPLTDFGNWPRMVQLAWQVHDEFGSFVEAQNHIVRPDGFTIPINAKMVHGISTEHALEVGKPLGEVLDMFLESAKNAKYLVGHNINFDLSVLGCEFLRDRGENPLPNWKIVDTCTEKTAAFCKIPGGTHGGFRFPKLINFYKLLFGNEFDSAHNASADVEATARIFLELIRIGVLDNSDIPEGEPFFENFKKANPETIQPANIEIISNSAEPVKENKGNISEPSAVVEPKPLSSEPEKIQFTHLHVHSHFSILDGMSKVPDLVDKCKRCGMYAMALTDHGNMFGIKEFADYSAKVNGKVKDSIKEQETILNKVDATDDEKTAAAAEIEKLKGQFFKPIFGTEAYCAPVNIAKRDGRQDRGWHLILLAKNKTGYKNLCKLASIAYTDGFYYNPRIDHSLIEKYHEGLICSSACLGGEVPQKIMNGDIKGAEETILWFKSLFGDDYYLEIQRHKTDKPGGDKEVYERQVEVNKVIFELAKKTNTKIIATNDAHFVEEEHGEAHDRLICLSTGKDLDDPSRMHYTKQEWLKSPEEMWSIFSDVPESLSNTMEIADKVESYSIDSDPIMPMFDIPKDFGTVEEYREKFTEEDLFNEFTRNEHGEVVMSQAEAEKKIKKLGGYDKLYRVKLEADYLAKLAWEGAKMRYGENLTEEQHERIVFELHIMKTMGFPGYFLIVQDYIRGAREELGVSVGPGRGSAAGSVVAYCLKITDVDPLKYDLLFERFLNPDRISLPDIDVDFDDDGRGKVLDWITRKYGKEKVAHIITYGTMATKSAIQDVSRVQKIPLPTVAEIKSYIPDKNFPDNIKDEKGKAPKVNLKNCFKYVPELKALVDGDDENISSMLTYAQELEDTNRQVGIHACGVIIGADDLTKFAPICTIKDKETNEDVLVTQYDGHVVESVGLIKMDFLGLKTLTQIKDALANIKKTHGIDLDIDNIPIDDAETYKLYSSGNTIGTFQFESAGMQKYLRELQPTVFEDLIAMNALYRPGPMDYIPTFIARKQGKEPIEYDFPEMEKYLKDTYGVTVYQEQVMLLSRQLANFTRGESDTLRKAMGKKQIAKMMELKDKFMKQGQELGHDAKILEKIWSDWEKFASYAFNKSHATCYSWVAYQTAYLKAHYPAEFMAAVLNSCITDAKEVVFMMDECKRMKISVLPPNVNKSGYKFTVDTNGNIYYGFGGIKGVGEVADVIREEREANGRYTSFADFMARVGAKNLNRKVLESLAKAGAFGDFTELHRAAYFYIAPGEKATFIEKSIRQVNASNERKNNAQIDLFGELEAQGEDLFQLAVPQCERWSNIKMLDEEKEVIGFYLSSHPLETYAHTIKFFTDVKLENINDVISAKKGATVHFAGIVTASTEMVAKSSGNKYGRYTVEDMSGSFEFPLFSKDFMKFGYMFVVGTPLFITGIVQEPFYNRDMPEEKKRPNELKIIDVDLLENVFAKTKREAKFTFNVNNLDSVNVKEILGLFAENKGDQKFSVMLVDRQQNMTCSLHPEKTKINIESVFKKIDDVCKKNADFADLVSYDLAK